MSEEERLRAKKKLIYDELYDKVKMEMFKASSKLEGIDYMIDETMYVPAEQSITPDAWVILEVNNEGEQFQKILSGWSGSYLYGDSWRLSSPIKEMNIDVDSDKIIVYTDSGSCYNLYKDNQGLRMSNAGIYNELKERFGDRIEIIEL